MHVCIYTCVHTYIPAALGGILLQSHHARVFVFITLSFRALLVHFLALPVAFYCYGTSRLLTVRLSEELP